MFSVDDDATVLMLLLLALMEWCSRLGLSALYPRALVRSCSTYGDVGLDEDLPLAPD
jgi:hypothetical protein